MHFYSYFLLHQYFTIFYKIFIFLFRFSMKRIVLKNIINLRIRMCEYSLIFEIFKELKFIELYLLLQIREFRLYYTHIK